MVNKINVLHPMRKLKIDMLDMSAKLKQLGYIEYANEMKGAVVIIIVIAICTLVIVGMMTDGKDFDDGESAENLQNSQNIPEREETKLTDSAQSGKGE